MRTRRARPATAAALLALAGALGGCGIRSTSVPVDAGAAPSRVSCFTPTAPPASASSAASSATGTAASPSPSRVPPSSQPSSPPSSPYPSPSASAAVWVYLVCDGEVTPVRRALPAVSAYGDAARRLATARALLDVLQSAPGDEESASGFGTDVPGDLDVAGPLPGDPATALRLSDAREQLPSFALAQIVCTFAGTPAEAGPDGTVVLGFAGGGAALRFSCSRVLRDQPDAARTAGTAIR